MIVFSPPAPSQTTTRNGILNALSQEQRERILSISTYEELPIGTLLFDVNQPIDAVYFIEEGVTSLTVPLRDGSALEAWSVGREGMVGLPLFLDCDSVGLRAFQDVHGAAQRLEKHEFLAELERGRELRKILGRFTQATITSAAQRSACNGKHSVEQRYVRWLLTTDDQTEGQPLRITHQFLAQMLGVRRATVTTIARLLQDAGYISCGRGSVAVMNRIGLEALACECYTMIRDEYQRQLPVTQLTQP